MSTVPLIIDSALLLGIIGVSVYGARVLPGDARLPLHFGPGGYTNWQPRNIALVLWPVLGIGVFVVLVVSAGHHQHGSGHGVPLSIGLTVALALMVINHVGAIRAALDRSGRS